MVFINYLHKPHYHFHPCRHHHPTICATAPGSYVLSQWNTSYKPDFKTVSMSIINEFVSIVTTTTINIIIIPTVTLCYSYVHTLRKTNYRPDYRPVSVSIISIFSSSNNTSSSTTTTFIIILTVILNVTTMSLPAGGGSYRPHHRPMSVSIINVFISSSNSSVVVVVVVVVIIIITIIIIIIPTVTLCVTAMSLPDGGGATDQTADQCGLGRLPPHHPR